MNMQPIYLTVNAQIESKDDFDFYLSYHWVLWSILPNMQPKWQTTLTDKSISNLNTKLIAVPNTIINYYWNNNFK